MDEKLKTYGPNIYKGLLLVTAVFSLLALTFISVGMWQHRVIFYFLTTAIIISKPYLMSGKKGKPGYITARLDIFFLVFLAALLIYTFAEGRSLLVRVGTFPLTIDVIMAVILTFMALEVGRRTTGYVLPVMAVLLLIYSLFGRYLPGFLYHHGVRFGRLFGNIYSPNGLFGEVFGICTTYVIVFVMFGAFLESSGSGEFLIKFADILCGRQVGGTAKAAIVGSGLMGMISGSTVSNVMTVGSITIPMMIRSGIAPTIAAGIEAVASTGGQIMPPILGAAAFVMAETTGISYSRIAMAAIIPALFYYVTLYAQIHYYSKKNKIAGLSEERMPLLKLLKTEGYLAIPILLLVFLLFVRNMSPVRAGLWAAFACVPISWVRPKTGMRLKDIIESLNKGVEGILSMVAICAMAATVIQLLDVSGLGLAATNAIMMLGENNVLLALIITAGICIVLGMGMPTVPAYVLAAVVTAPALVKLGLDVFVAHFFVFYYACMSSITPPIALGAYAASSIAKSDPTKTGLQAVRLGLAGLLAPFIIAYRPSTLLIGPLWLSLYSAAVAFIGLFALAVAIEGYFQKPIAAISRAALFFGFILMTFIPVFWTDALGLVLIAGAFFFEKKRPAPEAAA